MLEIRNMFKVRKGREPMRLADPIVPVSIRSPPSHRTPAYDLWTDSACPVRDCAVFDMCRMDPVRGVGRVSTRQRPHRTEAANVPIPHVRVQIHVSMDHCTCENVFDQAAEAGPGTRRSECCTCLSDMEGTGYEEECTHRFSHRPFCVTCTPSYPSRYSANLRLISPCSSSFILPSILP